ncbi:MAG TPA: hypothetical protein VH678_16840 [Xanthobacteraceae bacterium]
MIRRRELSRLLGGAARRALQAAMLILISYKQVLTAPHATT